MRGATRVDQAEEGWGWFQSAPLMRGATLRPCRCGVSIEFQSAPLMRGATLSSVPLPKLQTVSIRAPHARGDQSFGPQSSSTGCFNPRPSCEGRLAANRDCRWFRLVSIRAPHARGDHPILGTATNRPSFNPRPSCEGRLLQVGHVGGSREVSIRAPHARGDFSKALPGSVALFQSAPLMRGATTEELKQAVRDKFQSAPLMRGATISAVCSVAVIISFNPRPSCEGRRHDAGMPSATKSFNPRPSCEGRQSKGWKVGNSPMFQSAPLMRGATLDSAAGSADATGFQSAPLMRGATFCRCLACREG